MLRYLVACLFLVAQPLANADRASRDQALIDAAARGDLSAVKQLVRKGAGINAGVNAGGVGQTPLMAAVLGGQVPVARFLLNKGADPNVKVGPGRLTPLTAAATGGDTALITELLAKGANVRYRAPSGWTALASAAYWDHPAAVKLLLKAGAPVDVLEAVALGQRDRVKKLLTGKNPNALYAGSTLLVLAAGKGHTEIVRWLLDNGARIDERPQEWSTSALLVAADGDRLETVRVLLERGASLKVRDAFLRTPVIMAAGHGNAEMVRLLIGRGADVNERDVHKKTALHYATKGGHAKVAEILRIAGAVE
jgi:uncharacterized protein